MFKTTNQYKYIYIYIYVSYTYIYIYGFAVEFYLGSHISIDISIVRWGLSTNLQMGCPPLQQSRGWYGNATMRFLAKGGFTSTGDFTDNALGFTGKKWSLSTDYGFFQTWGIQYKHKLATLMWIMRLVTIWFWVCRQLQIFCHSAS